MTRGLLFKIRRTMLEEGLRRVINSIRAWRRDVEQGFETTYNKPIVEVLEAHADKGALPGDEQFALEYGKVVAADRHELLGVEQLDENLKQAQIMLAGPIAESILLGQTSDYRDQDTTQAWQKLTKQDADFAYKCQDLAHQGLCKEARELLAQRMAAIKVKTYELLKAHEQALKEIAHHLAKKGTLFADELAALAQH